jgi:hypothetical protein
MASAKANLPIDNSKLVTQLRKELGTYLPTYL